MNEELAQAIGDAVGDVVGEVRRELRDEFRGVQVETGRQMSELGQSVARMAADLLSESRRLAERAELLEERHAARLAELMAADPRAIITDALAAFRHDCMEQIGLTQRSQEAAGERLEARINALTHSVESTDAGLAALRRDMAVRAAELEAAAAARQEAILATWQRIEAATAPGQLRQLVRDSFAGDLEAAEARLRQAVDAVAQDSRQAAAQGLERFVETVDRFSEVVARPAPAAPDTAELERRMAAELRDAVSRCLPGLDELVGEAARTVFDDLSPLARFSQADLADHLAMLVRDQVRAQAPAREPAPEPASFPAPVRYRADRDYDRGAVVLRNGGTAWIGDDGQLMWLAVGIDRVAARLEGNDLAIEVHLSDGSIHGTAVELALPEHVGTWQDDADYRRAQEVAWNGCTWRARDALGRGIEPGKSPAWQLIAKQGRNGKSPPPAPQIVHIEAQGRDLRFVMSDDTSHAVPLPERLDA